jgi:hypothetical protein
MSRSCLALVLLLPFDSISQQFITSPQLHPNALPSCKALAAFAPTTLITECHPSGRALRPENRSPG